MFDCHQKPTGTQYTISVALLAVAFIFSPVVLIVSRPLGYASVSMALVCSGLCIALARIHWKKYSQLTIPSLETPYPRSK